MKALIIEDEKAAVRNLKALLLEVTPEIEVMAVTDSITDSIEWLRTHPMPDVLFLDIHLADGSAFEIFEYVDITCPIVFTTAYDEYALKAFKVNSIDYLLKPIDRHDMQKALDKLNHFRTASVPEPLTDYTALLRALKREEAYKTHFLVPLKGDKLYPLAIEEIHFFYIHESLVKAVTAAGKEYVLTQTLDELCDCLPPSRFFRVNRQYLVSRIAVQDIDLWFNGRLSVNLSHPIPNKILVSKARVAEFKEWFTS